MHFTILLCKLMYLYFIPMSVIKLLIQGMDKKLIPLQLETRRIPDANFTFNWSNELQHADVSFLQCSVVNWESWILPCTSAKRRKICTRPRPVMLDACGLSSIIGRTKNSWPLGWPKQETWKWKRRLRLVKLATFLSSKFFKKKIDYMYLRVFVIGAKLKSLSLIEIYRISRNREWKEISVKARQQDWF